MKVDGLGVVLSIILLPIILIVTYYIQLEVDTIATENSYNTKLLDATYDAMSAFEINTANESLSSVADSMRSIILASNNIFLNTLATNLGLSNSSKEYLEPYVPAVLYTLYDGYYIYAPTEIPKVARKTEKSGDLTTSSEYMKYEGFAQASDGKSISDTANATYGDVLYELPNGNYTADPAKAKKDTDYVLKSYVQYSARYANGDTDVTINYTLDNYINVVGTVNGIYYTKTGYLIKPDRVTSATANLNNIENDINLLIYNEKDAEEKILGKQTNSDDTTIPAAESASVTVDGQTISVGWIEVQDPLKKLYPDEFNKIKTISQAEEYLERAYDEKTTDNIRNLEYAIQKYKAIAYYTSSSIFSNWVYGNLSSLTPSNIVDDAMKNYYIDENGNAKYTSTSGVNDLYYDFSQDTTTRIFDKSEDPEDTTKAFYNHKLEVIKNSIKYNLNLVMSAYNQMDKKLNNYEASMPVLLDEEWDKILSNISILAFMQGWDCGLDIYNNYEFVSSTNNELTVAEDEIYYVPKGSFNNETSDYHRIDCPYLEDGEYISFRSKDVKYDKVYDKAGITVIDSNNESSITHYKYDHKNLACYTCINNSNYDANGLTDNKQRAKLIGMGNARQSIYKTNALPTSEGYKIYSKSDQIDLTNVSKLQITISNTVSQSAGQSREPILVLELFGKQVSLVLDQKAAQTVEIDVNGINGPQPISDKKISPDYDVGYEIESIKAIYK